ncbi:MAG: helix-turn-helix domain-containing protein [Pseudomonadota bacterium]
MDTLNRYPFPGNVRELENIVERAVALSDKPVISCPDLPGDLLELTFTSLDEDAGLKSLEEVEKDHIRKVLTQTDSHKGRAADILKIPRTTLWRKIKQYNME